jgi:hypothetical protein
MRKSDRPLTPCYIGNRRRRQPHNPRSRLPVSPSVSQLEWSYKRCQGTERVQSDWTYMLLDLQACESSSRYYGSRHGPSTTGMLGPSRVKSKQSFEVISRERGLPRLSRRQRSRLYVLGNQCQSRGVRGMIAQLAFGNWRS